MAEDIQLVLSALTLPWAVVFIALFAHPNERWWRTAFGWSLMLIALAVLAYTLSVVLYRWLGPYFGRDVVLVASAALTLVAMASRTVVLAREQYDAGRFGWVRRLRARLR